MTDGQYRTNLVYEVFGFCRTSSTRREDELNIQVVAGMKNDSRPNVDRSRYQSSMMRSQSSKQRSTKSYTTAVRQVCCSWSGK